MWVVFGVVVQSLSYVWLCNPMHCSTPGFLVLHYLPEFGQTHIHWVCDAIELSHPLLPLSLPVLNLCQHQGLFQWVGSSHQVAKVLEPQLQHQFFNEYSRLISFRIDWFFSPCCPQDSQRSSPAPHFENINSLAFNLLYGSSLTSLHDYWKNYSFAYFVGNLMSLGF